MEPKLNLIFFNLFGQKYVKKFKFLDIIRDIEIGNIQLPLPEKVWKHGKDKAVVNLYIYDNNGKTYDYKFIIFKILYTNLVIKAFIFFSILRNNFI